MKVNWWPFALIFYTDNLPVDSAVPPTWRLAGTQRGFIVSLRPEYRGDEGLLAHELVHIGQAWRLLMIGHALLYLFNRRYKLWAEVQAYREQMRHPDRKGNYMDLDSAVRRLRSPRYGFDLTEVQARAALLRID